MTRKPALDRLTRRHLRLSSGLVMFAYIAVHFVDHALGLVSLAVAERALALSVAVWHSLPGTALLVAAAAVHVGLAFQAVYDRRTLRMPPAQMLRIALGLFIPVLLIGHVVATRLAAELHGLAPTYSRIVWALWVSDGEGRQLALQAPGWVHGCMGLAFAFGHRPWWRRFKPALFGAAILLPVLAGLGFLAMGRELAALSARPDAAFAAELASTETRIAIGRLRDTLLAVYLVLIGAIFLLRALRSAVERQRRLLVPIAYPARTVSVPRGWSVLEASRGHGIPHLSMCGGQGRCSTCRVRVLDGGAELPPPSPLERRTLDRIQAGPDVRLACQLRPTARVVLAPMLDAGLLHDPAEPQAEVLAEQVMAVLAVRVAGWSAPQGPSTSALDHVYALNRVLATVGEVVQAAGGQPGAFDSEGATATFAGGGDLRRGLQQALAAAAALEPALAALDARLANELGVTARVVIALHCGAVAVGPVRYGRDPVRLAVGPGLAGARALGAEAVVNGAPFAISRPAARALGWREEALEWRALGADAALQGALRPDASAPT